MSIQTPSANEQPSDARPSVKQIAAELIGQAGCEKENGADSTECKIVKPEQIVRLIGLFRQSIFPHLIPGENSGASIAGRVASLLNEAGVLLPDLIRRARATSNESDQPKADDIAADFLASIPEIQRILLTDIQAAFDGDPACKGLSEVVLCYPGVLAVTVYRLANGLAQMGVPLLPRMMTEWAHSETGIDIHPGATIGNHFFIDHGTGVVIGETCHIGNYVKIYQGVTLGALSFPKDDSGNLVRNVKRHPTLEDRVVIYANATVLGGETVVGHDSVIGSSVWLTSSVDPKTTVMMERAKLRLRSGNNTDFEPPLDFQI